MTTRWLLSLPSSDWLIPGLASQYVTVRVVRYKKPILIESETHCSVLSFRNSLLLPYTPICYLKMAQCVELSTNLAVKAEEQPVRKVAVITGITGQVTRPAASTVRGELRVQTQKSWCNVMVFPNLSRWTFKNSRFSVIIIYSSKNIFFLSISISQ